MMRCLAVSVLAVGIALAGCGGGSSDKGVSGGGGTSGAGVGGSAGASVDAAAGSSGAAGATGGAGANGGGGASLDASGEAGVGGAGAGGGGGATGLDAAQDSTTDASAPGDASAGPSFLPAGYKGTPFTTSRIPGRVNAADYDRGGAGVGYCHDTGNCGAGTTTGDWYPAGSPPYRPPIPANDKICSGAACDDNVGVCRMSPNKPDKTDATTLAPAADTYLCYSVAGEWTKYTVVVAEAGTYSVGGFMAVPQGGAVNISFGSTITTGNLTLAVTNPSACGGGEYFHCWAQRDALATVTFPAAGTYLMTLTQVARFNADNFTFTKM